MMRMVRGFTLVELMIAVFITVLTLSTIYLTLTTAIKTQSVAEESMDLYQSARNGIDAFSREIRTAINPESFWKRRLNRNNTASDSGATTLASLMSAGGGGEGSEVDLEGETIIFKGSSTNVSFVVVEADARLTPKYDLREYQYKVDTEKNLLKKVSTRSALKDQMAAWRAMRFPDQEEEYLSQYRNEAQNNVEKREYTVTDNVMGLRLRYFDGEEWRESWDSEEIMVPADINPEEVQLAPDERPIKIGLPAAVEIVMTFTGNRTFYTITDVPGSLLNQIVHEKSATTSLGRGGVRYHNKRGRRGGRGANSSKLPDMIANPIDSIVLPSIGPLGSGGRRPPSGGGSGGNETKFR
jgi:prepilin-type N-terminal cleavage/methylation domain-containing protein